MSFVSRAKNAARLRKHARTAKRMQLPVSLIADLYNGAPIRLQVLVENYLTVPVVDILIARRDAELDAAERARVAAETEESAR